MNRPVVPFLVVVVSHIALPALAWAETGREIIDASGVQGGLVIHVHCGDGRLTADLATSQRYVVHGLDSGPGSAPVSADGKVYVALPERHAVQALDAQTGRKLWTFTAGGRVDSPPTIYGQLAVFGSHDGSVYCLRSDTGELVWRLRVAPQDRQVESAWPVHGSVLVRRSGTDGEDATVYAAAGRSGHLDGGIHVCGIDLATGHPKYRTHAELPHQVGNKPTVPSGSYSMEGILADVLVANGPGFCMRQTTFNDRCEIVGDDMRRAMFAVSGLLDDACDHRSFWVLGGSSGRAGLSCNVPRSTRDAPYVKMFVFNENHAYGFRLGYDIKERMTPAHHQDFSVFNREEFPIGGLICAVENNPAPTTGTAAPLFAKGGKGKESRRYRWSFDTTVKCARCCWRRIACSLPDGTIRTIPAA